ncbi:MAG: hypothetical protein LBG19_02890 [Prevotellaceae bacterium]|nr:hypothetical protein [Prevotellaceae bacterium]
MKKLSTLLILLLVAQLTFAQGKFDKKLSSSDADIANPKKKEQVKTWINRGNLFVEIAEDPVSRLLSGMDKNTLLSIQLRGQKPIEIKTWKGSDGEEYEVYVFDDKDLYFNEAGLLSFWTIKKTEVENPANKAFEAYTQAKKLDPKAATNKELQNGFINLQRVYGSAATDAYMRDDLKGALNGFKGMYEVGEAMGVTDTSSMYNVAFLANTMENYPLAEEFYKKCIAIGYTLDGAVYASLADVIRKSGRKAEAEKILTDAYTQFPINQSILISLINFYMEGGDDPTKVIPIIKTAQANEPGNASLDYAEGSLYEKLNDPKKAEVAYKSAIAKDPKNFFAQYSLGALYYNQAVELSKKADELPIDKQKEYDEMIVEINALLKKSIVPFEAAYAVEQNPIIVESLKNVYYRFVDESPEMKAKYDQYNALLKQFDTQ